MKKETINLKYIIKNKQMEENTILLENISKLRIEVDELLQNAEILNFHEYNLDAVRSLKMAKCWLGKAKGALGNPTPYNVATDPKSIPPTDAVYTGELFASKTKNYDELLKHVNTMRAGIESVTNKLHESENKLGFSINEQYAMAIFFTEQHLSEARFWYGFVLAEIRKNSIHK